MVGLLGVPIAVVAEEVLAIQVPCECGAPPFTGNVLQDFDDPRAAVLVDDREPTELFGSDIESVHVWYNSVTDTLYVGLNTGDPAVLGGYIAGDTDGDGDPGNGAFGGFYFDFPNLGGSIGDSGEFLVFAVDVTGDGCPELIAGVPPAGNINGDYTVAVPVTGVNNNNECVFSPATCFGVPFAGSGGRISDTPSSTSPHIEFTIEHFLAVLGLQASGLVEVEIGVTVLLGSGRDAVNEDMIKALLTFELPPVGSVIGDTVWNDENGNGKIDTGEVGLANVIVELWTNPTGPDAKARRVASATTDGCGHYLFTDVAPGDYEVRIIGFSAPAAGASTNSVGALGGATDWVLTTPGDVPVGPGDLPFLAADFGLREGFSPQIAGLGGSVWNDLNGDSLWNENEPPIEGAIVDIFGASGWLDVTVTDSDGTYAFVGLSPSVFYRVVTDESSTPLLGLVRTCPEDDDFPYIAMPGRYDLDFGYTGCGPWPSASRARRACWASTRAAC